MEPINATIEPTVKYDINIGGLTFRGFTKDGTWNGMTAFTNNQGTVIVNEFEGGDKDIFKFLQTDDEGPKGGDFLIVKASPFFYEQVEMFRKMESKRNPLDFEKGVNLSGPC